MTNSTPSVIRTGALDMQVCVPNKWTDEEITLFANRENLCGTQAGWCIRTDKKLLAGAPYRNQCSDDSAYIHVTLDA